MVRREQFTLNEMDSEIVAGDGKRKGIYVSPLAVVIYVIVTVFLAAAVGVIVYFTKSRAPAVCSTPSSDGSALDSSSPAVTSIMTNVSLSSVDEDQLWAICVNLSMSRNECLPGALSCSEAAMTKEEIDYVLPRTFWPRHYHIELKPDVYKSHPADFSYQGTVVVFLECLQSSDVIVLHQRKMIIDEPVVVRIDDVIVGINRTETVNVTEFYRIYLDRPVAVGQNVSVTLNYHDQLRLDMTGLYYSEYVYQNETKYLVVTQLEATDARKVFPCLDEPSLKATFQMTIWRKEPMVALTNMPLIRSEPKDDGWIKDYFDKTPVVMSTYLVAAAIADYKHIEKTSTGGLKEKLLRHWSRPDFIDKGYLDYSLEICLKIFDYFENYFGIPFDLPKQDQISIPDFESGAMENWGLVTYREGRMVYDPNHVTLNELQKMTGTLAHELLHQWLGNIVTCAWWSDLWLNEGMARYHEYLAMEVVQPDWDVDQIYAAQVTYRAFNSDQLGHSHPMHNPVDSPSEIERMFNSVTYDKAACVIRMIDKLVLRDSYKEAMRRYLRENAYDSVTFVDLLRAWDEQAEEDKIPLEVNISMVMATWITQMGFPLVTMEKIDNNTIRLSQKLFRQNPERPLYESYPPPYNYTWDIPLTFITSKNRNSPVLTWLHRENKTTELEYSLSSSDWLMGNYLQYGFYRINYDLANWEALINQLKSDHSVFHVTNRGQLIHDSFNLGRSGDLPHLISLKVTEYLSEETDYLPWFAAAKEHFSFFNKIFRYAPNFSIFKTYVRNLMLKNYKILGWKKRPQDTHHDVYLRELLVSYSCLYDNTDCIQTALDYFRKWKEDPSNTTIIPPDIRNGVYCTAIHYGLPSDWDFLFDVYRNFRHFSNEKYRLRRALTCSSDRTTLTRLFYMAATLDPELMSHDPNGPIGIMRHIARSSIGHYVAWEALDSNWDYMQNRFTVLASVCDSFSTEYDLEKFQSFLSKHPPEAQNEKENIEDIQNIILHNIRWRSENENMMFLWLRNVTEIY